jgi:hypothetical protein
VNKVSIIGILFLRTTLRMYKRESTSLMGSRFSRIIFKQMSFQSRLLIRSQISSVLRKMNKTEIWFKLEINS